jgi:uncharacterized protein (DUF342 family)
MRRNIAIDDLKVGMFVEAGVSSISAEDGTRHFLEIHDAEYAAPSKKRVRLIKGKHREVAATGGMSITSQSQIAALRDIGLARMCIDVGKGDDLPLSTSGENAADLPSTTKKPLYQELQDTLNDETVSSPDPIAEEKALEDAGSAKGPDGEGDPLSYSGRRRNFGASQNGWMKVDIDEQGRQAVLRVLSFGGDSSLTLTDVIDALEKLYHLQEGVDRDLLEKLVTRAVASPERVIRGQFPIARAPLAEIDGKERIHYTFLDDVDDGVELSYEGLRAAFSQKTLDKTLAPGLRVKMTIPGEKLAVVAEADGKAGLRDIFGNSRRLDDPEDILKAGENVKVAGNSYIAEIFGYVCLLDDEISVISPLWISPDNIEAHFIHLPQIGTRSIPVQEWLLQLLQLAGVKHGTRATAINALLSSPPDHETTTSILFASGTQPIPARGSRVELAFDPESKPCRYLPDGSVDFKERNTSISVKQGQLLAELFPATPGQPGIDLAGNEIVVEKDPTPVLRAGKNVRIASEGTDPKYYYSRIDGNVKVGNDTVDVHSIVRIFGDVDYELGNLAAGNDVYISGSVLPGFSVQAEGDVIIGGTVEPTAQVRAKGDVIVAKGILGDQTRVVAMGDLHTKVVQNSTVMARGDITIGSYLLNANVRAGGQLLVKSGTPERSGSIIGGQVYATTRLQAARVGSSTTDRTRIGIGFDPDIITRLQKMDDEFSTLIGIGADPSAVSRLRKFKQGMDYCDANILRAFRTLGLREINAAQFKALIERTPRQKRKPIMHILRQLKGLVETREKSLAKRQELEGEMAQNMQKAEIEITSVAAADVQIRMGDENLVLSKNLNHPTFSLSEDGIIYRTQD